MKIIDISMEISLDMQVYKNKDEKKPRLRVVSDFTMGSCYESRLDFDLHTGTHLDAPLHMLESGETIDTLPLDRVYTPCRVVDLTGVNEGITREDLASLGIQKGDFVLFKTRNSFQETFDPSFVYLAASGAEYLFEKGISGVGIDALGIERAQPGHETHKILLGNGVTILEGLRLKAVEPGEYMLVALPLKIKGAEAAPVRAVLICY